VRRARTLARGLWTVPPIAVGCGLAVVSTPAAEAAFPGRNGVIVFANAWRELQLVTIRPDGSGIALLSRRGGIDPHWSPDGTRLIVSVSDHLYVMDARKDATRREVAPVGYDPSWTPDGRSIVYTAVDKQGEAMMFTVRADGTQRRRLFRFGLPSINDAELSPTGRWLVLIAPEELPAYELHLYVVGINGRGLRRIVNGSDDELQDATWSPDGTRIAYVQCPNVVVIPAAGGPATTVATVDGYCHRTQVRWSPDGKRIAYAGAVGLQIVNADGTGNRRTVMRDGLSYGFDWQPLKTP
jgi:Tol biopolymer transport system component